MADVLIKIKKDSKREYLTTPSGYTITKDKFVKVDDKDITIQSFLFNRNDIEIKDTSDKKVEKKVEKKADFDKVMKESELITSEEENNAMQKLKTEKKVKEEV